MKSSALSVKDVIKLLLGLVLWLALIALTYYTFLVFPLAIVVGGYLVFMLIQLRSRIGAPKPKRGYPEEKDE
jgi:hypothetical protein